MRKYLFISSALILFAMGLRAQVSTYQFTSSVETYTPLNSEIVLWNGTFDDGISGSIAIPDFTMDGITYNNMYVSANGFVTLGNTDIPSDAEYYPISGTSDYDKALAPFSSDLSNAETGTPQISYNTNDGGEIVVQWQDVKKYGSDYSGQMISFQLRMNPSTGLIRFVYGGTITGISKWCNVQVGLRGTTNTDFNNRETTTDWLATTAGVANDATCTMSDAALPAEGLTYRFSTCFPISHFPFTESFDAPDFAPMCWENVNTAGPGDPGTWDRQTSGTNPDCLPHSGAAMARFNSWDYGAGTTAFLSTQQLLMPTDQFEVHFWMYRDDGSEGIADLVNVYYNTVPNTTGATLMGTVNRYYQSSPAELTANQWYEYVFKMPSGSSGNAYILFEGMSAYGTNIFLDDVSVKKRFECPGGATAELEPCGTDINGGCNLPVPAFEPISLGETKCGTVYRNASHQDTDWYKFTLAHRTELTLKAQAEFPLLMGFYNSPCPQGGFIASDTASAYLIRTVHVTLDAGTYYAAISPTGSSDIVCGSENRYWLILAGNECYVGTLPFSESFNDPVFPPNCWKSENTAGTGIPGTWDRQTSGLHPVCAPHSGAAMARFDAYYYNAGTKGILATPQFENLYGDQYEVRFWMYRDGEFSTDADSVNVYYSWYPGAGGATRLGTVHRYYGKSPAEATANKWYEYVFRFPAGSWGNAYIVFEGVSDFGNSIYIDDIRVKQSITCPASSSAELEPCGSDLNGGCNMAIPAFESISMGLAKCGTVWCDGINRDSDWYTFTLTESTDVTFTVNAEFPALIGLAAAPCPASSYLVYNSGPGIPALSVNATLPAGTYYAIVKPKDLSTIITCGVENKYWAALEMCPMGSTVEQEPCLSDLNGGCNMAIPAFEPITVGETKCGTAWCNGSIRDTDWHLFTLTQQARVTWKANAEFPVTLGFINAPCPAVNFSNYTFGPAGSVVAITSLLGPGTYYAWIGPKDWSTIIQCGGADKYWAKLSFSTCVEPSGVAVSLISATTATISWTAPSPAPGNGYEYEIRSAELPGSGPTGLAASGTTADGVLSKAISGLNPVTTYHVYVRSVCGSSDISPWTNVVSFTTLFIETNKNVQTVILPGQSFCYDALQTITVAGGATTFIINIGGSATMIAGLNILYLPGTHVISGGYMHGYIAPGGPFCVTPPLVKAITAEEQNIPDVTLFPNFKIYPNPTTGNFSLEQRGEKIYRNVKVEVYGMYGEKVMTASMIDEKKHDFSLSELSPGLYFVRIVAGDYSETIKLIKTR
ncbi:MAG: choice-of-anchor J domain-containing protein [Bacteroidota bacterium]